MRQVQVARLGQAAAEEVLREGLEAWHYAVGIGAFLISCWVFYEIIFRWPCQHDPEPDPKAPAFLYRCRICGKGGTLSDLGWGTVGKPHPRLWREPEREEYHGRQ
jgi:hypothetical protein